MDERDRRLEVLALAAKQHPPQSKARRVALTQLISEIQKSGKLFCQGKSDFPPDVYKEALQEVWLYICRKIDNYGSKEGSVMAWVNFILDKRFKDAINRYTKQGREQSLDVPASTDTGRTLLETVPQPEDLPSDLEAVRQYLQADPESLFRQKHVEGRPEASFQAIALRRIGGESWSAIASDWNIPIPTLSTFYQRCIRQFAPKFREYLQN